MVAVSLPLDILDVLLDALIAQETDKNDRCASIATLRACSLVHPAYIRKVQKHLFSTINLEVGIIKQCLKFSILIQRSPHLATYVETLTVSFSCLSRDTSPFDFEELKDLVPIITALNNIQFLHLFVRNANLNFLELPNDLQHGLLSRFRTLTGLECRSIFNLPMRDIASGACLKKLSVFTPRNMRRDETDELFDSPTNGNSGAPLEQLHTDDETCLPYFTGSTAYPLQVLALDQVPFRSAQPLLRLSQSTLRHLAVTYVYDVPKFIMVNMDFPCLETMKWDVMGLNMTTPQELYYAASILESGDNTRRPLKSIIIIFSDHFATTSAVASLPPWSQIDTALSHPRYDEFEMLSLTIFKSHWISTGRPIPLKQISDRIEQKLARVFPFLHQHGKVRVKVQLVPYHVPTWW